MILENNKSQIGNTTFLSKELLDLHKPSAQTDCKRETMDPSGSHKKSSAEPAEEAHPNANHRILDRTWLRMACRAALIMFVVFHLTLMQSVATEIVGHVTCGSVVKLSNEAKPKVRLHSHDIKYGSGSGQQSVTAAENQDTNSYWSIMGAYNKQCNRGQPIECGSIIRLQHVQTRKFLHSHLFKSPLSSQQEVSAFGNDDESDTGDHWTLSCPGKVWLKTEPVRLKHVDTDSWLSLSGNTYGRPIYGQMEVICSPSSDKLSFWKTVEGVFVQPTGTTSDSSAHDEL